MNNLETFADRREKITQQLFTHIKIHSIVYIIYFLLKVIEADNVLNLPYLSTFL
jgi:hypothetical protein